MRLRRRELDELPHTVREALEALKPVPDVDPVTWEQGRQAFIIEARQTAMAHQTPAIDTAGRPGGWRGALGALFDVRKNRLGAVALKALAVLILVLGGSVGTVAAARGSLPGSALYGLKLQLEQWELTQAHTPEAVSERALIQSGQRVEEAARLAGEGRTVPDDLAAHFQERLSLAMQASGSLGEPQRLQAQSHISETLRHQMETMAQAALQARGENEDDQAIMAMIRTMEETQAQLGPHEDIHDDTGPGDRQQATPGAGEQYGPGENDDAEPSDSVVRETPEADRGAATPESVNDDAPGQTPGEAEDHNGGGPGDAQPEEGDHHDDGGAANGPNDGDGQTGEPQDTHEGGEGASNDPSGDPNQSGGGEDHREGGDPAPDSGGSTEGNHDGGSDRGPGEGNEESPAPEHSGGGDR